jgi:hypothetical protein
MKTIDCTTCQTLLPDLLQEGSATPAAAAAHLADCPACRQEFDDLRATWALMDEWTAPEPSAYFDTRLYARLREAETAAPESLWQRMAALLRPVGNRGLRPAMAGALAVAVLLGGGTAATLLTHHGSNPSASPTVNDLRIYDNNAQALQQMDLLDESGPDAGTAAPQS